MSKNEEGLEGLYGEEMHRETDPDAPNYNGVAGWVQSLKAELFNDLTTDDVCYITGLDKSTVLKYLKDGTIEGYQLGRSWRVTTESLRRFKEHLIAEAKRAVAEARLEHECERLQAAEPDTGWDTARCPKTDALILVQDETELGADAWVAGIQEYVKTGRKVGECAECSWRNEDDEYQWAIHHFGPRSLPPQAIP